MGARQARRTRHKPFFPAPNEIDSKKLAAHLTELGIAPQRRDEMVKMAINAVLRYGQPRDHVGLRNTLSGFSKAAQKLLKCIPEIGTEESIEFLNAIEGTFPKEESREDPTAVGPVRMKVLKYDEANDRLRRFYELRQTLEMSKAAAEEASARMTKSGAPSAKIPFVKELKIIWEEGVGKARSSGAACWEHPGSKFAYFVKICIQMMPRTDEFERDFGGLISRAVGAKPPRKILSFTT
jgi:hypothetical protein